LFENQHSSFAAFIHFNMFWAHLIADLLVYGRLPRVRSAHRLRVKFLLELTFVASSLLFFFHYSRSSLCIMHLVTPTSSRTVPVHSSGSPTHPIFFVFWRGPLSGARGGGPGGPFMGGVVRLGFLCCCCPVGAFGSIFSLPDL